MGREGALLLLQAERVAAAAVGVLREESGFHRPRVEEERGGFVRVPGPEGSFHLEASFVFSTREVSSARIGERIGKEEMRKNVRSGFEVVGEHRAG